MNVLVVIGLILAFIFFGSVAMTAMQGGGGIRPRSSRAYSIVTYLLVIGLIYLVYQKIPLETSFFRS